jgi:predicted DNA-binding protein
MTIKAGECMNKTKQIIVRMTDTEKKDLENIAKETGRNVSKLVRELICNYVNEKSKQVIGGAQ